MSLVRRNVQQVMTARALHSKLFSEIRVVSSLNEFFASQDETSCMSFFRYFQKFQYKARSDLFSTRSDPNFREKCDFLQKNKSKTSRNEFEKL